MRTAPIENENGAGRAITAGHWKRISAALNEWAATSFVGCRNRALILLCRGTGLRVSEALALNVAQVLEDPKSTKIELRTACFLRKDQIKGKKKGKRFVVPKRAKTVLRAYIKRAIELKALRWPATLTAPLFLTTKNTGKGRRYERLSKRMAQESFKQAQTRAGLPGRDRYRFHDLRHTYATLCSKKANGDPYEVARAARLDSLETSLRYVHQDFTRTVEIVEAAGKDL